MAKADLCGPLWSEGMFLTPQHLQQMDRQHESRIWLGTRHHISHPWGFTKLKLALEELANYNIKLLECQVILPGGALAAYPGNLDIPARDFHGLESHDADTCQVFLGIPEARADRPNLAGAPGLSSFDKPRYTAVQAELADINSGEHVRSIELARLRGRIFFEFEQREGYLCIPLARIKTPKGGELPRLDPSYIPPCLTLEAWEPLQQLAREMSSQVSVTLTEVKKELRGQDIAELLSMPRGQEIALKHMALAGAGPVLMQLSQSGAVHPYDYYLELNRLCSSLDIFAGPLALEAPPLYNHYDLGLCFGSMSAILITLLQKLAAPSFQRRAFTIKRERLMADLQADWVTGRHQLFLAVSGLADVEEAQAQLSGLKLCAPSDRESVVQRRLAALNISWLRQPPGNLPAVEQRVYGAVQTSGPYWSRVQDDLALVISGVEDLPLNFDLYVV